MIFLKISSGKITKTLLAKRHIIHCMSARMKLNSWVLPVLLFAALVMQVLDPSRTWKTVLVALGLAWLLAWFWARGLVRGVRLVREVRYGWAQVGDEMEERFNLLNGSAFPATWVEVADHSNMPGYEPSLATFVDGRSATNLISSGQCHQRGVFTLGGTTLRTGDPLGIYSVFIEDHSSQTLLVLPPVVPLPSVEVTPGGYLGEGRPLARTPQETVRAAGVREYQPGDPLRNIHWPTSARHNKLYSRQFDGSPSSDWWILLDLEQAAQVGVGQNSTEEQVVILAASLADQGLRGKRAVGLAVNGNAPSWLAPRENESQRWAILHALALAHPGPLSLRDFLARTGSSFGKQASLVLITASTSPDWLPALAPLVWRGIVPTVLLLDVQRSGKNTGPVNLLAAQLQHMGIRCHIIPPEALDRPEARPGQGGQWAWRVSKITGKVETLQRPENLDWRRLS